MAGEIRNPFGIKLQTEMGQHYFRPDVARPSNGFCALCGRDSAFGGHTTAVPTKMVVGVLS